MDPCDFSQRGLLITRAAGDEVEARFACVPKTCASDFCYFCCSLGVRLWETKLW